MAFIQKLGKSIEQHPLAWLIGTAATGIGVYFIWNKFGKAVKNSIAVNTDESALKSEGQKLSYPLTNYQNFADKIYQAGMNWSITEGFTDEEAMYDVFRQMKNDLDIVQLFKAFGMRRAEFSFQDVNLGGFLQSELDPDEIQVVNKILTSKGIKYRF